MKVLVTGKSGQLGRSIKKIISVCKKNDVSVMEGFSYRFHPQQKEVERILDQKKIGVIRNFSSYFFHVCNPLWHRIKIVMAL